MKVLDKENGNLVFHIVDFRKASPGAIDSILTALNKEVDEALLQGRNPSLNNVFDVLNLSNSKTIQ